MTAWQYRPCDRLLHVPPLHHIHGTVNAILTPLLAGSSIEFMYPCKVDEVWRHFAAHSIGPDGACGNTREVYDIGCRDTRLPITFFNAVPTIWSRMLESYTLLSGLRAPAKEAISSRHLRLNISGSAALPKSIRDGWT
ncbi:hypothetical protein AUEXF2481DRAFT_42258 [Aureobasidium subglaciale EXF-2481]|uniref:AMP-dependent synthetase/ligase domain-containing protein n=1 Tax=Aureobasidium subglaciale (strain EXF-2481) TaxID=1043005 RepID=A0A074YAR6_AURSE|nr:uncharacterized protein AUEXF2481DRAFT_42258 [Aureobasidium subglaciale EXF-2481]KEQ93054.1 hypothetical protein AUEXF2481DRAFT_42258 [Aureobasidium subglaciale EXF-2481]